MRCLVIRRGLFPWRTISGVESSPFFEAGLAQHHINSDIAYGFIRYYESTKETDIFFEGDFEVLLETSRLFMEIGYVRDGKFHIDKVTGPDEYSVLVMLFPEEESLEVVKNSVHYYDEVTTHDSSLSYSAFSIVYNRVGDTEKSYQYFLESAHWDLDNLHGNTKDGLHTASMVGTFMNILYGFCDLRFEEDKFTLNPKLPKQIQSIRFSIVYKGEIYHIQVNRDSIRLRRKFK